MSTDLTFSEEWLKEYCTRTGQKMPEGFAKAGRGRESPKPNKYRNKRTARGNLVFASQHEAEVYDLILLRLKAGEIRGFTMQHPFVLPGGVKYFADFVILNNDQTYAVLDAKSEATRKDKTYRLKRRQMKECLGIEIVEV